MDWQGPDILAMLVEMGLFPPAADQRGLGAVFISSWSKRARIGAFGLTVSLCLGAASCSNTQGATTRSSAPITDISRLVNVDGHKVFLQCKGYGSPTVVLISGAGVSSNNWDYVGDPANTKDPPKKSPKAVEPRLAMATRVCAYDRPGTTGFDDVPTRSTPVSQPTTAQGDAQRLHDLLLAANVPRPYLLVAHSWGGFIATTYSRLYPSQVVGMVLIDPGSAYLQTVLPADVWSTWMQSIASYGTEHPGVEQPDYPASIAFLSTLPPAPEIPTIVLTSDKPIDFLGIGDAPKYHPGWVQAQALLAQSLGGTQITNTHSGHFIQAENPELVIEQVEHVIAELRHP
ncbi:MAG TPA: alpha/beta hydrolase [Acidimicrobiales bacterium]|nr:alpha/beta hydrolase [Acidimicrobiales bacterium]